MADWNGIRAAIATKCGSVAGINSASAADIDAAPDTPAVIVTHTAGIRTLQHSWGTLEREADINGVLVVSRAPGTGVAAETADDLLELLFTEWLTGLNLGYPAVVQDSWITSASFDLLSVGGIDYAGYRITWTVRTRESKTYSMNE